MFAELPEGSGDDMKLTHPVPELPVNNIEIAVKAYAEQMGFTLDWKHEDSLAGICRDAARIFLRRRTPQEADRGYTVTIWINLNSAAEVDLLHASWKDRGVSIVSDLHTAQYNLREFAAQDIDGNRWRVFYDLGRPRA